MQQVEKVKNEIDTLEAQIEEAERPGRPGKGKANHQNLLSASAGTPNGFELHRYKIANLEPQNKQRLIEAVLDGGKIEVEGGPEPGDESYFEGKDYSKTWR